MPKKKAAKKNKAGTLAIRTATAAGIDFRIHEYAHDPSSPSYGEEAVQALGLDSERVFKTLIARLDSGTHIVVILPVSRQMDLKAVAAHFGAKKAAMADKTAAERLTGYVLGGISPLGQRQRSPTVIDRSADDFETVYVSAGRRGLEIELAPDDLASLCDAQLAPIAR